MSTETWPRSTPPDPANPAADQWVAIGPAVCLNGAPAGRPRVCGAITCLQVSSDGQRIYAGTTLGGVWYSGDGGFRWRALDFYASVKDSSGNLVHTDTAPVGALAVQFGTDATDLVVAGPGGRPPVGRQAIAAAIARGVGLRVATGPAAKVDASGAAAADPWLAEATTETGLAVAALAFDRVTNDVVWAATNKGLYRRQTGGGTWKKVDPGIGGGPLTGVVTVPGVAAEPERVYVASADGHVARSTDGTTWQPVALPAHPAAAAAVPFERLVLAAGNVPGHAVVWVLAGGPRLWRIDGDTAEIVAGLPAGLLLPGGTGEMALAAHPQSDPGHVDMIAVGGGALTFPAGTLQAHLYLGQVTRVAGTLTFPQTPGPAGRPVTEWIGAGVPFGVRALTFASAPVPIQLWAGTSAGVFRSANAGAAGSFDARLTGLASAELNSLAVHPFADGVLYAGARDLGMLHRVSAETWQLSRNGTAGGVGIDPADPRRVYAQSSQGQWNLSVDGGASFADLGYQTPVPAGAGLGVVAAWSAAQSDEASKAALTSRIALTTGPAGTQVALGTDRVYYTDDAMLAAAPGGRSGWVTLPTASDPYDVAKTAPDRAQDRLDGPVLVPRWADRDHLCVLTRTSVYGFTRAAGSWTRQQLYDQVQVHRNWKGKVPSGLIPDDAPLLELAVHQITGSTASLYVGTAGPDSEDHLWWYDGTSKWLATGLPTDAAVHALAVDPSHREVVYAGTDIGVWKGTGTFGSGSPSWAWSHYSDGLPEAPCVDLAVFTPPAGGPRLLRGAFGGRGVFEVALDGQAQGPEVYLRADAATARRGNLPVGGGRDPQSPVRAQLRLDASPDIRIWRTPLAAPVQPLALPVGAGAHPFDIFVLQSALRVAGADVPTDGRWSPQVAAALAQRVAVLGLPGSATPQQVWNAIAAGSPLAFDLAPPDAADLVAHQLEEPDRWPKAYQTSCANGGDGAATMVTARIQVVVHARHWHPIPAARISVALLKTPYAGRPNLSSTAPLPAGWAAALAVDRAAPPGGGWLGGTPWSYVDTANPFRAVPAPADPAAPQVVTFDADLTGGSLDWPGWLLLAVVVADDDPLAAVETNVAKLVRADRHVAARSVRHANLPAEPPTRCAAMDVGSYPGQAVMTAAWQASNLQVTGMYLDSPATVPGQAPDTLPVNGHNRSGGIGGNPVGAWMSGWRDLYPRWGILTIYWGQQDPANGQGPISINQPANIAALNAVDAQAKAAAASIPPGAVIYLDWEVGGVPSAGGVTYCTRFFHSLAELGYRPGVYAHPRSSTTLKQNCPGLYIWNVNLRNVPAGDLRVVNHQLLVRPIAMAAAGELAGPDPDALARQYEFQVAVAGNPVAGFPAIDLDVAIAGDPGYPERRNQPLEIRSGHAAAANDAAGLGIYAIRRGKPVRATWAPGAGASDPSLNFANAPFLWNPYSAITAVRTVAPADVLLAFGFDISGPSDLWRLQAIRREAGATSWRQLTVPQGDIAIDPLPGIAASTRGDESIEAFVVDMDAGAPAGARFDPDTALWSALETVPGAGTAPVRRTNRLSVVSRATGQLDLFWVGTDSLIHTSSSAAPGNWGAPIQVGDPAVHPHPMANLIAISRAPDRIDVLFVGRRDGDPAWRLYDTWWDGGADGWGAPPHAQIVGGAAMDIEPLSPIAACARTADHADAFAVGAAGALLISTFDRVANSWSALAPIGGQPVFGGQPLRVSSVDGAVLRGGAEVDVVVTGRDQTVWTTHFDAAIPGYTQLERIVPLDPA